ncbi:hypothetical protein ACFLQN_04490 [Candidatus Aenigmatarchaeota archaeon]
MEETSIEDIMEKARSFQKQGKKWHFHMLTPDCTFNEKKDKHAFVLENVTDSETYVVYSDTRYMEQGQELVKMIHGDKITESSSTESDDDSISEILEKAKQLNEKEVHWHHHMFFPECEFNKHKGKWCIVFEDNEEGKIIEFLSDSEPTENLKKIEALYYAQKE